MKNAKASTSPNAAGEGGKKGKTDAISLLKSDHRKVEQLFEQYENSEDDDEKRKIVRQVCTELIVHTTLEEELFYPACREKDVDSELMDEAQVEHDGAKILIGDLLQNSPGDQYYDAKVKTLSEYINHHVGEEEQSRSGIFAKAQKAGVDIAALGEKIQARKTELMAQGEALSSQPPQLRSFKLQPQSQETSSMARNSNDRDRDERGRFTEDDDNRGYESRGGNGNRNRDEQGRFTDDGDNRGGYSSRGGGNRDRDEEGRFTSNDNNRGGYQSRGSASDRDEEGRFTGNDNNRSGYSSRGSNRGRDEEGRFTSDNGRSGGRGQSQGGGEGRGWYGDSEGHSQASERGWEERQGSRGYSDDNRGSRSGGYGGGQGHGGNQGEGRGWYGDSQGHSRAAERGWEERGYSGRQSGNQGRGSSRSQEGHGGWFGDSEGHSEAARRGWQDR